MLAAGTLQQTLSLRSLSLEEADRRLLSGEAGPAAQLAMRIITEVARAHGAERLIDVRSAHVDGCLYHGRVSVDFAERLAAGGAAVSIPTTLNVGALDLLHPNLVRAEPETRTQASRLMDLYVEMGCRPTWTCAPYQLPSRPSFGEDIAWGESNAIVFANSVLGARTDRYGDFIDICAAITGRAPFAGLHRPENRRAGVLFRLRVPDRLLEEDAAFPVLGHLIGRESGTAVPVVDGLPSTVTEDQLKALGAAAASSGSVALFHVVGVTPEAPTLDAVFEGSHRARMIDVDLALMLEARDSLSTASGSRLDAISLGTPHFSVSEFRRLVELLDGVELNPRIRVYVSTGRHVLADISDRGWADILRNAGVRLVVDTCTYITPILDPGTRVVMTNSAKWAYYAPGNIGVDVVFGSLEECVRSAVAGTVWRDPALWRD